MEQCSRRFEVYRVPFINPYSTFRPNSHKEPRQILIFLSTIVIIIIIIIIIIFDRRN